MITSDRRRISCCTFSDGEHNINNNTSPLLFIYFLLSYFISLLSLLSYFIALSFYFLSFVRCKLFGVLAYLRSAVVFIPLGVVPWPNNLFCNSRCVHLSYSSWSQGLLLSRMRRRGHWLCWMEMGDG